jgi:hypothetical protein
MSTITISQFKSNITAIKEKGRDLDNLIHESAVFAVFHSIKDGQITPAIQLVAAMPKSSRRANLISWLALYGNISYNGKKGVFYVKQFEHDEAIATEQADNAAENPFWKEFNDAPVDLKPLDFALKLKMLLAAAHKVQTGESKKYSGLEHAELMAKIEALMTV